MKRKTMIATALLVALMAGSAVPALARGMGEGHGPAIMFDAIDADKDGNVTEAEVDAFRANWVAGADADKDGLISLEELTAQETAMMARMAAQHAAHRMERQDANGDGQLSAEELLASPVPANMFARLDANGDGAVSKEEFDEMRQGRGGRGERHGRGMGGHGAQQP